MTADQALRQLLATYLEVRAGRRPRALLRKLLPADLWLVVEPDLEPITTLRLRGSVAVQRERGRLDGVALLDDGQRVRALTIRLRQTRRDWEVTTLAWPDTRHSRYDAAPAA